MHVQAFLPAPILTPYVEQYLLWEVDATPLLPVVQPIVPGTVHGIDILYRGAFHNVHDADGSTSASQPVALVGMVTHRQLALHFTSPVAVLGIHFRPGGFYQLFGVPAALTTDEARELGELSGPLARELAQRVPEAPTDAARVAAVNELLERQLRTHVAKDSRMGPLASQVLHTHGQLSVDELAHAAGLSCRQLERRFLQEIGMSPKLYARIARFNHVFRLLDEHPAFDWQDVAFQSGYFDQAHFIREFHQFSGETPGAYFAHFSDFARHFWAREAG